MSWEEDMDLAWLAAFLTVLSILIPILVTMWKAIKSNISHNQIVWSGIMKRGYLEARAKGYLSKDTGNLRVSDRARKAYTEVMVRLQEIHQHLTKKFRRTPTDDELTWAIEEEFQDWMIENACAVLNMNQHGCLAVASILARETVT